jgi:hypothetical protein
MEALQIRVITETEKTKFTDHVISFFKSKLEEGWFYLPPFLLVSKYSAEVAQSATKNASLEPILVVHLKVHLTILKFLSKDLDAYSKSVVDEKTFEQYFFNLLRAFSSIYNIHHESDQSELLDLSIAASEEVIRILYNEEPKHRGSLVGY